ncbi:MAG: L-threonylcarbamoyladenylate synthase [Anaerolineales bacterium]|nr:L-threonylcarbamoyladenylate synthase [Anaerolineales bacterium]MCX7756219.1 L-threonylcarbamoyladenylate synthase [Anaerolineales bacterium]MDW8277421.1 L-threonylcarbamoyladenylate synthase [Anaerolineales bacterium]
MTELLPATPENIAHAAKILHQGGLVAFPTETVYGLGANALNEQAARNIFTAKGRPTADPLIVHLSGVEQLPLVAHSVPQAAYQLMQRFWPGPLTLLLPKQPTVPDLVTSGLETVAVRVPAHPVALALLRQSGLPLAAPSANRFGHTSPTTAQHVWHDLRGRIDLILDGGPTTIGVESTVLDLSTSPARILRPGGVTREMLEAVIGPVTVLGQKRKAEPGLPSPGLLEKHYAPRAEMILFTGEHARQALQTYVAEQAHTRKIGALAADEEAEMLERTGALVYRLGSDLESIARHIYAGMRWLDSQGVEVIVCRDFGESGLGLAVRDRLTRAAGKVIRST